MTYEDPNPTLFFERLVGIARFLLIYEKGHEGTQKEDLTFYTADSTREMDTRFLIQEDMNL